MLICVFLCVCFNIWQRSMKSCVPEGRNLTCCLSSQSSPPLSSLDYHQVEAYRASEGHSMSVGVYLCQRLQPVLGNDTMLLLSVTEGTALFLLTINKERRTIPLYQMWVHMCPILVIRRLVISSTVYSSLFSPLPVCPGPGRLLRSPAGFCVQGSLGGL